MRRLSTTILFITVLLSVFGQEKNTSAKLEYNLNIDLLSSHLWRGFKNGNSLSIQPDISLKYKGFIFGAWAAYAENGSYFEVDIYTEYTYKTLNISIYDYFCPLSIQHANFWDFRKNRTKHTLDFMIQWEPKRVPFRILASTMVWGDDKIKTTGRQAYSTYIEPALTKSWGSLTTELFAGLTPYKSYYAKDAAMVNIGISVEYSLKINQYKLPIKSKISHNPRLQEFWYMLGVSFSM